MITTLFKKPSKKTQDKLEHLQSCPWKNINLPAAVSGLPTMLMNYELQVLHWLASQYVDGSGRIVDGGCFLGGSTGALASGLTARGGVGKEKTIASYDLFRIEPYTLDNFGANFTDPTVGASFRPDFERYTAPWAEHIEIREGDAVSIGWSGEPIEVLFLDLVKTWRLNDFVLDQFLPSLIPGHSIIIQQDYMWGFGPWIHITMELLARSVTILDSMLCSVVYLVTGPIPQELIGAKIREELSPKMQMRLMNRAVNRWTGQKRGLVELARVMLIRELYPVSVAREELAKVVANYPGDYAVEVNAKRVADDIEREAWWTK